MTAAAHPARVQHFFVERDLAAEPVRTLHASYRALKAIDLAG